MHEIKIILLFVKFGKQNKKPKKENLHEK